MECVRCRATFEGRFCPRCGAPATPPTPAPSSGVAPAATGTWPCPACGTPYFGNFCPRCGLPTAAWALQTPQSTEGGSVLSILWTLAMVAFLVFAATDFAGLAVSPTLVVPGISGLRSGSTVNAALDLEDGWTNNTWNSASALSHETTGGHPSGYLKTT